MIQFTIGSVFSWKGVRFKRTFVVAEVEVLPPFLKGDRGGFYGGRCQASRQVQLPKIPPGLPLEKGGAKRIYRRTHR